MLEEKSQLNDTDSFIKEISYDIYLYHVYLQQENYFN